MLKSKLKPHRSGLKDVLGRTIQQHRERAHSDPVEGEELSTPPPIGGQNSEEHLLSEVSAADSSVERGSQGSQGSHGPGHRRSSSCDGLGLLGACANKRSSHRGSLPCVTPLPEMRSRMESVLDAADTEAYKQRTALCKSPAKGGAAEGAASATTSAATSPAASASGLASAQPQLAATVTPPPALAEEPVADKARPLAAGPSAAALAPAATATQAESATPSTRRLPPTQVVASAEQETALSVRKFNEKATRGAHARRHHAHKYDGGTMMRRAACGVRCEA